MVLPTRNHHRFELLKNPHTIQAIKAEIKDAMASRYEGKAFNDLDHKEMFAAIVEEGGMPFLRGYDIKTTSSSYAYISDRY